MSEIEQLEARIAQLKHKDKFIADLKALKCPFCGGSMDYNVDYSGDFYGYEYDAKGKIFCTGCGCFGKEYESRHNNNHGSESNMLEQIGNLSFVLGTLERYANFTPIHNP